MQTDRKKLIIILVASFSVLAVAAIFLAAPLYHQFKVWRARSLSESALELVEKGGKEDRNVIQEAWESASAAYRLVPQDYEVVRALAEIYSMADPAQALSFWEEALAMSDGAAEDRLKLVEAALATGRYDLVEEHLPVLEREIPGNADFMLLKARFLASRKKFDEALQVVRKLIQLEEVPDSAHFLFVQLSQLTGNDEVRREGIKYLWKLAERKDNLGLLALRNLANLPDKDPDSLDELIRRLEKHPLASNEDYLILLDLKLTLPGADADRLIQETRARLDLEENEEKVVIGRWLNRNRLYSQTLSLIDRITAVRRQDLFLIYMDALAALKKWDEIGKVLDLNNLPVEDSIMHVFKMRYFIATGEERRAEIEWNTAVLDAGRDQKMLWYLVNYASRLGYVDFKRSALEELTGIPASMRQAYEELLTLEQSVGDTHHSLEVIERMAEIYPNDPAVINDQAYLNLLLDRNVEESLRQAEKMVKANPHYLAHRVTLVLAYYRAGNPQAALSLFKDLPLEWAKIPARWKPVLAAVLKANGNDVQANQMLEGVDLSQLLPEERQLAEEAGA